MNIQEQIKNLSDKELLEKYKNKDEYFQNVQELLEKEVSERNILIKTEIKQNMKVEMKSEGKNKTKILWSIAYLLIGIFMISVLISPNNKNIIKSENISKKERVYNGKYKWRINKKYPDEFAKAKKYRKIILKSIKGSKETRDKNNIYYEYFDDKGRLVYKIKQPTKVTYFEERSPGTKGTMYSRGKLIKEAEEVGYIYDNQNKVEVKLYVASQGDIRYSLDDNHRSSFFNGSGGNVSVFEYRYVTKNEKILTIQNFGQKYVDLHFNRLERRYINDVLVSEKELIDEEEDNSFIMLNTEKRYNNAGKLIYKMVDRTDKENGYKSYTEMDFENHKAVTKYYKDKNIIATITEDFLGEEKTMLDIEMWKGKEISRFYKMQEKSIVKREKKGSSLLIYDVYSYGQKEGDFFDRYIVDKGKLVYIFENCKAGWVWNYTRDREGLNENSCYIDHIKNERMFMISELGNYKKYEYDNNSKKYNLTQNIIMYLDSKGNLRPSDGREYIDEEFAQGIVNTDFDKKVNVNKRVLRKGIDEKEVIFNEKEFYKKIEATLSKK